MKAISFLKYRVWSKKLPSRLPSHTANFIRVGLTIPKLRISTSDASLEYVVSRFVFSQFSQRKAE